MQNYLFRNADADEALLTSPTVHRPKQLSSHSSRAPYAGATSLRFRGKLGRIAAALAISAVFLWFTLRSVDTEEVVRTLSSASPQWLWVALVFYWLEILVRVQRWLTLLHSLRPLSFGQVMISLVVGYAANNALPARLGELFRADFIGRRYAVSRFSALGTIFVERLLDMLAVLICAGVGVALMTSERVGFGQMQLHSNIVHGLIVVTTLAGILIAALFVATSRFRDLISARFPWMRQAVSALAVGVQSVKRPHQVAGLAALSIVVWVLNGLAMWSLLAAVGISPSARTIVLLLGLSGIAAAIPAAPANIGTLQFAFVLALGTAGYSSSAAFAAASLVQVALLGSVTIVGAVIYVTTYLLPRARKTNGST